MLLNSSNKAIVASAGSGKTEELVIRALSVPPVQRVLLTTFTDNGANEIRARLNKKAGITPANIEVIPWLTFLLRHGVKPYQNPTLGLNLVGGLHFDPRVSRPKKTDIRRYYLDPSGNVYREFLAELAILLNEKSEGAVINRISGIFDHLYFDEIQDISARDFEFLELVMMSPTTVTVSGDPRQGTFSTTQSRTNRTLTKSNIVKWIDALQAKGMIEKEVHRHSLRCNQAICDFSDALYPDLDKTQSRNSKVTGHDGIFLVKTADVLSYAAKHSPQLLVWDKNSKTFGLEGRNMGDVKGLTYDRIIINPTITMVEYLTSGAELAGVTRAKFYVGVTRARYSVAIILDKPGNYGIPYWDPDK